MGEDADAPPKKGSVLSVTYREWPYALSAWSGAVVLGLVPTVMAFSFGSCLGWVFLLVAVALGLAGLWYYMPKRVDLDQEEIVFYLIAGSTTVKLATIRWDAVRHVRYGKDALHSGKGGDVHAIWIRGTGRTRKLASDRMPEDDLDRIRDYIADLE